MYVLLLCKPFEMILIKFMPIERVILKAPAQKCLLCATIFFVRFQMHAGNQWVQVKIFLYCTFYKFQFLFKLV